MVLSNFKSYFRRKGGSAEERVNGLVGQLSVNAEYISTFRTKSYIEMLEKAHEYHLGTKGLSRLRSSLSSSSLPSRVSLCDYLLEPRQETLVDVQESSHLHPLVINFFEATFAACNICDLVLSSVYQARANYSTIQRVIKLRANMHTSSRCEGINCEDREALASTDDTHAQCCAILEELASFARLKNPLLSISPLLFQDMHNNHGYLLKNLTAKARKVKRRAKFARLCKKTLGLGLLVSYSVLATAVLLLAIHSMVGILVAPPVLACSLGLAAHEWKKLVRGRREPTSQERLGAQLEVAAKGVYVLMTDFDTMSRLVRRLEGEIEHIRVVGDMCVRNGKMEVVEEGVREIGIDQKGFLEQLDEFEEQILLFFLNMNKSRRLVMQEILGLQQQNRIV